MKKLIALTLSVLLFLSALSTASALTVDLSAASLDELLQLQQDVAARISELRTAQAAAESPDRIELSGTGTTIVSDVVIPFSPSRLILQADGKMTAELTGDSHKQLFNDTDYTVRFCEWEGTFTLLVETKGNWSFVVEPIVSGGSLPLSGSRPFISDFFELSAPIVVTIQTDPEKLINVHTVFKVSLRNQNRYSDGWDDEELFSVLLSPSGDPFAEDIILKPVEGRTLYCLSVDCAPGVEWSISPK